MGPVEGLFASIFTSILESPEDKRARQDREEKQKRENQKTINNVKRIANDIAASCSGERS